ncbi:hypothetical protein PM082_014525 [Marasmius tenuissimus]|nr:hypothetical protein PM082_014525 [Marasmius tenuissimus]
MPTTLTSLYLHNVPRGNRPTPEKLAITNAHNIRSGRWSDSPGSIFRHSLSPKINFIISGMFTQNTNTADRMDNEYRESLREETIEVHEAVMKNQPLTRLHMEYPIFYETEANQILLLGQSSSSLGGA